MDRSLKIKLAAGVAGGLAAAGTGGAIAATQLSSPKVEDQAVVKDAAAQLGVQPNDLSSALKKALEDRVDAAVSAGRLSKAQGEAIKQRIESGDAPLFAEPGPHLRGGGPFGARLDSAASYLGLTTSKLRSQLESGKSLAAIAKAQGKSVDGLVQTLVAATRKRLDSAVSAGQLTSGREGQILSELKQHITAFVNGTERFGGPGRIGPHPGFAPGGPPPGGEAF